MGAAAAPAPPWPDVEGTLDEARGLPPLDEGRDLPLMMMGSAGPGTSMSSSSESSIWTIFGWGDEIDALLLPFPSLDFDEPT